MKKRMMFITSLTFLVVFALSVGSVNFNPVSPSLLQNPEVLPGTLDLSTPVESIMTGLQVIDPSNASLDTDWTYLQAVPRTAFSLPKVLNFTQTVKVCNKADDAGYLYLDYWFTQPLEQSKLTRVDKGDVTHEVTIDDSACTTTGTPPNNVTTCGIVGNHPENRTYYEEHRTVLNTQNETWNDGFHNHLIQGQYFNPGQCVDYEVNYKPVLNTSYQQNGEWNMEVWGNNVDDWQCVLNDSCAFRYVLDPSFSTAFLFKKNIQINMTNAFPATNNASISINFSSAYINFNHVSGNGNDVLFTNFDETQALGCYKESFDNTTQGNYTVLITNLSNATNTSIWMYYGNFTAGFANQCPEINNAYILADLMNSSSINSSIWNDHIGSNWGVGSGTSTTNGGIYNVSTTNAQICQQAADNNQQNCWLLANTTGVLKQSQRYQVYTRTMMNCTISTTPDGWSIGWGKNESTNRAGALNVTFQSQDGMGTNQIIQNNTVTFSFSGTNRTNQWVRTLYRKINNQDAQTLYSKLNSTGLTEEIALGTANLNGSTAPTNYLNDSNKFWIYASDGSGATGCNNNGGMFWDEIRVTAFLNQTPVLVFGTEQDAGPQPPITSVVTNATWETSGVRDSGGVSNYTVFVLWDGNNYNNISQVNFSINGITYHDNQIDNVSNGTGNNMTKFNISVFTPLNQVNDSAMNFNWSFLLNANSSANNVVFYQVNHTQPVDWGWYVNNFTYISPLVAGSANPITVNFTKGVPNNQVGMNYNVTLEWNQTNATGTTKLLTNATGYEEWNTTFATMHVTTTTTVQMKGWLNISFNGSFVTRDPNATQVLILSTVNGTTFWQSPVNETNITMYSLNVSWSGSDYNFVLANFTLDSGHGTNNTYVQTSIDNQSGFAGSSNWTYFNITLRPNLTFYNNTVYTFMWNITAVPNGSAVQSNTSPNNQNILWSYWLNNATWSSPVFEGATNIFEVNMTKSVDLTGPNFIHNTTIEYNGVNGTLGTLGTNNTGNELWDISNTAPLPGTYTWKAWLNLSFQGVFINRSNETPSLNLTSKQVVVADGAASNWTWEPVNYESGLANFTLNVTNHSMIKQINFTYQGLVYNPTNVTSFSNFSKDNYTDFNLSVHAQLIDINRSNDSLQWNWTMSTGSNQSNTVQTQEEWFANYINNMTWTSPIAEKTSNSFTILISNQVCEGGNLNAKPVQQTIEYNGTNQTIGGALFIGCPATLNMGPVTMTSPSVSADIFVQWKPWINVSFQGVKKNRTFVPNQTQLVLDEGHELNETYTTPIFETSLANFTLNLSNSTNILNINFTWNSSATQFNGTNITNITMSNTTLFNVTVRIPLAPANKTNYTFQWNWTSGPGDNLSSNLTNQTVLWTYYPNKVDLTPDLYESFPQTAGINVTKHLFAQGVTWNISLEYNQTNKTTALTHNDTNWEDWNVSFITPTVNNDLSVQARGWMNITYQGMNYLRLTSNVSQLIRNLNFTCGKCFNFTTNFTAVINFSFFDEFTNKSIFENGSDQITLWTTEQDVNTTFGCNFNNVTFHELCVQNVPLTTNFTANYNIQYGSNDSPPTYPVRELWRRNQTISNSTINETLYNLFFINATAITFTTQDTLQTGLENEIVEAYKYNISNNSYMLVDTGLTDFDGNTRLFLYKADDYYKIIVKDGGGQPVLVTSQNPGFKLLFNQYFLVIGQTNKIDILTVLKGTQVEHNLTFDNTTKTFVLTYIDPGNLSDNYCLEIVNTTDSNNTIISKDCSSNLTGSFSFHLTAPNGTFLGKFVMGSNSVLLDQVEAVLNGLINIGKEGFFALFILMGSVSAAGWVVSPPISLVLLAVGLGVMYAVGFLPIGWMALTSIVAVLLISALVIRRGI